MNNPELTAILDEVSAGRMSTGQRAHRMQQLIRDAEQAHRPFAAMVAADAELAGYQRMIKAHMKATCQVVVRKRTQSTVIGVRRPDHNGVVRWQQVPLAEATWVELADHMDMLRANAKSLRANINLVAKLLDLHSQAPGASTVGEAIAELETTVETVIGAAA